MALSDHPLVLSWSRARNPLPVRCVRGHCSHRSALLGLDAPPWHETGAPGRPFDFCGHMRRLCADIARRSPELVHVDVSRLLFAVIQARNGRRHGLQARVTPLRFRDGRLHRPGRGVLYQVQRYLVDDQDMLYLVTFCLPRFLDQTFDEKLITIFHELFHISPAFDGDLRRQAGRYAVHTHSKDDYDRHMAHLARNYLNGNPDPALHAFLRLNFVQLNHRHGQVVGIVVPRPKLIPVAAR